LSQESGWDEVCQSATGISSGRILNQQWGLRIQRNPDYPLIGNANCQKKAHLSERNICPDVWPHRFGPNSSKYGPKPSVYRFIADRSHFGLFHALSLTLEVGTLNFLLMNSTATTLSNSYDLDIPPDNVIFGHSGVMRRLRQEVDQIAAVEIPVLIHGDTGTGKEVLAAYTHLHSPRRNRPFIKISCASIPSSLLEAELFGYEQGAFTGAYSSKPGLVEQSDNGTLVLDHIAELDVSIQAKLLQLLQDGSFSRIGGQQELKIDTRVICIAGRDPNDDVADGKLRLDLFHRINAGSFSVPELRERAEDIPAIADYLIRLFNQTFETDARLLSPALCRVLQQYRWPGNIRELENVLRRYVILGSPEVIAEDITRRSYVCPATVLTAHQSLSFKARTQQLVREVEMQAILKVLHLNNWNRRKTAQMLNISYRALLYKIRSGGIGEYCPPKRAN
jgi:two-component system response regulator AtoC